MQEKSIKVAALKAWKGIWVSFPMIFGTVLLISLLNTIIPKSFYSLIFRNNVFMDSFVGSVIGSISVGNAITSYILGGEFLKQGVSLIAVTAFLVAWVTVGIVQLPAESAILGKKFALLRNIISFALSIIVAVATVLLVGLI